MKLFSKGGANSSWHYVRTVYTIHYSMIISIDQQHKPFESCWWQMKAHKRALKRHITGNSKQIFPEKELWGLSTNSCIHVSVTDLYIPTIGLSILLQENTWTRSQTHECVTWDWGSAIPFLGKHKWDFRCSAKSQSIPHVYQSYDEEIICTKTTETFRLFF